MAIIAAAFIRKNAETRKVGLPINSSEIQRVLQENDIPLIMPGPGISYVFEQMHENIYGWPLAFGNSGETYDGPARIDRPVTGDGTLENGILSLEMLTTSCNISVTWRRVGHSPINFDLKGSVDIPLAKPHPWNVTYFILDCLLCISTVVISWIALEYLIHRREVPKN
jgi:hypothetical protein